MISCFPNRSFYSHVCFTYDLGIDRCGKTTQSCLLADHLKATSSAELIRFPNRESCIGKLINSYLASESNMNDNTIHLLFSANRWEGSAEIERMLSSGTTLVSYRGNHRNLFDILNKLLII